jgi:hypothetical protein
MTRRESTATPAAPSFDRIALNDARRRFNNGTATRSDRERVETAEGIKAAAAVKVREEARSIIESCRALQVPDGDSRWLTPNDDGDMVDARDFMASLPARSRSKYAPTSEWLTGQDLMRTARRAVGGVKGDAEDLAAIVVLTVLEKLNVKGAALPRWEDVDRLTELDPTTVDAVALADTRRKKLAALMGGIARNLSAEEMRKHGAQISADYSQPEEGEEPTAEQRAAAAAEQAAGHVDDAMTAVDGDYCDAMRDTAPVLYGKAEDAAVRMALSGLTRADLAADRTGKSDAVKKAAQRGRKALASKLHDAAEEDATSHRRILSTWTRDAAALTLAACPDEQAERQERDAAEDREQRPASPVGARQNWPDREAPRNGGTTGHVPAWPAEREPVSAASRKGSGGNFQKRQAEDTPAYRRSPLLRAARLYRAGMARRERQARQEARKAAHAASLKPRTLRVAISTERPRPTTEQYALIDAAGQAAADAASMGNGQRARAQARRDAADRLRVRLTLS